MKYTEDPPTTPGWYWIKNSDDGFVHIMKFPHYGEYPKRWQDKLQEALDDNEDNTILQEELKKLNWVVKYAGPIVPPDED